METWGVVITLIICALIFITTAYLVRNEAYLVSIRVVCDYHDLHVFNQIIDIIAANEKIKDVVYRERDDVLIFDISCRRWHYDDIRKELQAIKNVEVS